MTPAELDEIEARANAATESPWWQVARRFIRRNSGKGMGANLPGEQIAVFASEEDAAFATHARTDVPKLVAEVRQLHSFTKIAEVTIRDLESEVRRLQADVDECLGILKEERELDENL